MQPETLRTGTRLRGSLKGHKLLLGDLLRQNRALRDLESHQAHSPPQHTHTYSLRGPMVFVRM